MDLRLNVNPPEKLRHAAAIPLHYVADVSAFARPQLLTSPYIDILFQETSARGYTLRSYIFNVRSPITLIANIGSPKFCIASMIKGDITISINEEERLHLQEREYGILYLKTDEHLLSFQPGKHEMLRCDYKLEKLEKYGHPYAITKQWLKKIAEDHAIIFNKGHIDNNLQVMEADIKCLPPSSYTEDRVFYKKYREILRSVLGQQDLSHTEN